MLVTMRRLLFVGLVVAWGASIGFASAARAQSADDTEAPPMLRGNLNVNDKNHAPGDYKGVAPGATALPPHPPRMPVRKGPQRMTWPGFQLRNGVPTVFLEVTGMPDYQIEEAPGEVIVTLKNTTVPLTNNRRPLDVTAFDTSVKNVAAKKKGRDVRVTITTRGGQPPVHRERIEDAAGGYQLLVIELPAMRSQAAK
jgi:hypothetical protein